MRKVNSGILNLKLIQEVCVSKSSSDRFANQQAFCNCYSDGVSSKKECKRKHSTVNNYRKI